MLYRSRREHFGIIRPELEPATQTASLLRCAIRACPRSIYSCSAIRKGSARAMRPNATGTVAVCGVLVTDTAAKRLRWSGQHIGCHLVRRGRRALQPTS